MYRYSATRNLFFPAISAPSDAIDCPHERYLATRFPAEGQLRQPDKEGLPVLVDNPNYLPPAQPTPEELTARATADRRAAYAAESDPLYMEWQYDGTPEAEQLWRSKVAEIKARYPLPSKQPTEGVSP